MRRGRTPTLYFRAWRLRLDHVEIRGKRAPALVPTAEWLPWKGLAVARPYFVSKRQASKFAEGAMQERKTLEALRELLRELEHLP